MKSFISGDPVVDRVIFENENQTGRGRLKPKISDEKTFAK